jgi:hypothetical protein
MERLEQLLDDDKVLSYYELEQAGNRQVFDWIRDVKDYEIRT